MFTAFMQSAAVTAPPAKLLKILNNATRRTGTINRKTFFFKFNEKK